MLKIVIPEQEYWDPYKEEFSYIKETRLRLEHSLISVHKWESRWHKSYFESYKNANSIEANDYIRCMSLDELPDENIVNFLTYSDMVKIRDYIEDPMTATTFSEDNNNGVNLKRRRKLTSEVIYSQMVILGIDANPYAKWHLNQLLTLERVVSLEQMPPKKRSKMETMERYMALNNSRRKKLNTKG